MIEEVEVVQVAVLDHQFQKGARRVDVNTLRRGSDWRGTVSVAP